MKIEIVIMQNLIEMMMNNRTAREIIIDLIDRKEITGEEAYTLIYELVNKVSWG